MGLEDKIKSDFSTADETHKAIEQEELNKEAETEEKRKQREMEREEKRQKRKQEEAQERRVKAETRARARREKETLKIQQEDIKRTEKMTREMEIESIKQKELKVKKLPTEEEVRLIPSKKQLGAMVEEAKIGIKTGLTKARQKIKKGISMIPERTGKLVGAGITAGVNVVKQKIAERQAYEQAISKARGKARLFAQKRRIYKEEMIRAGLIKPRTAMGMKSDIGSERKIGISMPIFQPRQSMGFGQRTINPMPIFQPRQPNIEQRKPNTTISIGKVSGGLTIGSIGAKKINTKKKGMELFDFKKKRGLI